MAQRRTSRDPMLQTVFEGFAEPCAYLALLSLLETRIDSRRASYPRYLDKALNSRMASRALCLPSCTALSKQWSMWS